MADVKKPIPTYQGGPEYSLEAKQKGSLKRKQKQSIVDEYNKPDPVGDFIRRVIGGNKARKAGK